MLRLRNSFDASQVLFLVLPLFVLVGIVPELPLPRAEYHVEGGAGDVNAGRDHEDEPPLRLSRLKNGKSEYSGVSIAQRLSCCCSVTHRPDDYVSGGDRRQ